MSCSVPPSKTRTLPAFVVTTKLIIWLAERGATSMSSSPPKSVLVTTLAAPLFTPEPWDAAAVVACTAAVLLWLAAVSAVPTEF